MVHDRPWSVDEFATLARSPHRSERELAHELPGRSADAIGNVRQGIHVWHRGQRETPLLSQQMKDWLEHYNNGSACAVCLVRFASNSEDA